MCGSNNCLQFGKFYHPKDDCCEKPKNSSGELEAPYDPFKNSIFPTYFRPIGEENKFQYNILRDSTVEILKKLY